MFDNAKHKIYELIGRPTVCLKTNVYVAHTRDGELLETREIRNLVTTIGKAQIAGLVNGVVTTPFTYVAVGTGAGAPAAGDTTLTEITDSGLARATATCTRVTTSTANDTAQLTKTWNVTGTKAITEAGVFDNSTGGNLLARQTFSVVNVNSGDTFSITWKIQIT